MARTAQARAFGQSTRDREWSTRCALVMFACLGIPGSVLDVGCGPGHVVDLAARLGARATGLDFGVEDGHTAHGGRLVHADLRQVFDVGPAYELVLCWEVGEHLPAISATSLVAGVAAHTAKGGRIVFTAAVPGQGGTGHVNEQPLEVWALLFRRHGYAVDTSATLLLRTAWSLVSGPAWWYGQNVQVFA